MHLPLAPVVGVIGSTLLILGALPTVVWAFTGRFTGKGRPGRGVWDPLNDRLNMIGFAVSTGGYAMSSLALGAWGDLLEFTIPGVLSGCFASALKYAQKGSAAESPAPVLGRYLIPVYPFLLGFLWRAATG
ncbi:hypothetical protein ACIRU8_16075 [Streptomyces sp. NPDC101175]|uniref:hypothetical protein n=1 Tax=Streptomyces sp. NPDC101175 TaxID=3366123 RepID=UPI003836D9DB